MTVNGIVVSSFPAYSSAIEHWQCLKKKEYWNDYKVNAYKLAGIRNRKKILIRVYLYNKTAVKYRLDDFHKFNFI